MCLPTSCNHAICGREFCGFNCVVGVNQTFVLDTKMACQMFI